MIRRYEDLSEQEKIEVDKIFDEQAMSNEKPRKFLTRPAVIDWLQYSDEFEERIDKPYMPQVALSLIEEYKIEIEKLQKERDQAIQMCEKLAKALELAIAQAGIPDAGGACRVILKTNGEALKEYREWKGK